ADAGVIVAVTPERGAPASIALTMIAPSPATGSTPLLLSRFMYVVIAIAGISATALNDISDVMIAAPLTFHSRFVPPGRAIANVPSSAVVAISPPSATVKPSAPVAEHAVSLRGSAARQTRPATVGPPSPVSPSEASGPPPPPPGPGPPPPSIG